MSNLIERLNSIFEQHGNRHRTCVLKDLLKHEFPGASVREMARGTEYTEYIYTGVSGLTVSRAAVYYLVQNSSNSVLVRAKIAFNQGRDAAFECEAVLMSERGSRLQQAIA